ncbi:MAG: hypothetical protein ACMUIL_00690 [bacterium]
MKKYSLSLLLLLIVVFFLLYACFHVKWSEMLSPGDLSLAHADMDLSEDCQACHTKGKQIDNGKCLDCHAEIQDKMDLNQGLHSQASSECLDCHSEHHGKETNIAYFDEDNFDHAKTGWSLEGRHTLLKCEACHMKDSFLLDKADCIHCHKDFHEGEYGTDCAECHDQDSFRME